MEVSGARYSWCLGALLALFSACSDEGPSGSVTTSGGGETSAAAGQGGVAGQGGQGGVAGQGGQGGVAGQGGAGGEGGAPCRNSLPVSAMAPGTLSQTGLYADIVNKTIAPVVAMFSPTYPLWSDAADKTRWIYLPECEPIDSSDMDLLDFPVGTRAFKEFRLDGKRLETRMIHRFGEGDADYVFAAYQWRDDESEADHVPNGVEDVRATEHDIPDADSCHRCHGPHPSGGGLPSRYLGFSALQLSHAGPGLTMASLSASGALTQPAPAGFQIPGNPVEKAALGYLHANCGSCHNDSANGLLFPFMNTFVKTTDTLVTQTGTYATVVNQATEFFIKNPECLWRVKGGDPQQSCIHHRMGERGSDEMNNLDQMPPIASDVVDAVGMAAVGAWIQSLPSPP